LNFGLSPDFSVQLKVSLSKSLSERLSQKLKWLTEATAEEICPSLKQMFHTQSFTSFWWGNEERICCSCLWSSAHQNASLLKMCGQSTRMLLTQQPEKSLDHACMPRNSEYVRRLSIIDHCRKAMRRGDLEEYWRLAGPPRRSLRHHLLVLLSYMLWHRSVILCLLLNTVAFWSAEDGRGDSEGGEREIRSTWSKSVIAAGPCLGCRNLSQ